MVPPDQPDLGLLYITMLRNPVEWTLSTYSVIFSRPVIAFPTLKKAAHDGIKLADFPQFLVDNGLANPQTRIVAGFLDVAHMGPPCPPLPASRTSAHQYCRCSAERTLCSPSLR